MNVVQHLIVGIIGVVVVAYLLSGLTFNISTDVFVYIAIAIFIGAGFPDFIEPGGKGRWNHRNFWHSKIMFRYLSYASGITFIFVAVQALIGFGINITFFVFALPFSYWLHLAVDSTTPYGLTVKQGNRWIGKMGN